MVLFGSMTYIAKNVEDTVQLLMNMRNNLQILSVGFVKIKREIDKIK